MPVTKATKVAQILNNTTGFVKTSLIDSDAINTSAALGTASAASTTIYTNLSDLPGSAATGSQAFVSSNNSLYIYNGSGWYKIALVNASPYWETEAESSYTFTIDTAITITLLADDSDGHAITYTATADSDANQFITITKDSDNGRIFTLTPDSENEAPNTTNTGTVTFKASDSISFASTVSTFTLDFRTSVDNSAGTVILIKGVDTNGVDNESITYQDSSNVNTGFTEVGDPLASSFSPYASGGYSTYFPGSADYLSIADDDTLEFGSGDFTMEAWVFPMQIDTSFSVIVNKWDSSSLKSYIFALTSSKVYFYYSTNGSNQTLLQWTETVPLYEWTHLAIVREGDDLKLYVDGTAHATTNSMSGVTLHNPNSTTKIGILGDTNSGTDYFGYIRDLRLIKGTAQYTANFTAPTEALTAVSGTSLLTCHLPYYLDGSTNDHTVTANGALEIRRNTPYDKAAWTGDEFSGSVLLDGSDALENTTTAIGTSDYTLEGWVYVVADGSSNYQMIFDNRSALTTGTYGWYQETDDKIKIGINSTTFASDTTVTQNAWYHWAIVRSSDACTFYLNGKAQTSNAGTSISTNFTGTEFNIGRNSSVGSPANGDYWYGYQSDFRYSKSAKYTSDFTPPTTPLSQTGSELLMNNSSDANIYNAASEFTLDTTLGIVTDTSTRKWTGSSSIEFDNTANGLIISRDGPGYSNDRSYWQKWLAGAFTFEGWFYLNNDDSQNMYLQLGANGGNWTTSGQQFLLYAASGVFYAQWNVNGTPTSSTWTEPDSGAWFHYACVHDGTNVKQFLNGTQVGSTTVFNATVTYVSGGTWTTRVGGYSPAAGYAFDGYMQDVRFSNFARYTTAFTAPTAEFEL